ncbi:TPA: glycosyltransferase, partial [Enterobacter hormaechei]|nr:glycosyltransferase [Enterobacter hormaechei]
RACYSVFSQIYQNIEIIIVDDNSSIDLSAVIAELIELSPFPIYYYKNECNKGACYSRNLGIERSNGIYVTGLDDDDEFTKDRISKFLENYNHQYSFVSSNAIVIKKKGTQKYSSNKSNRVICLDDMLWSNVAGTQVFVEKERILKIGGFDVNLSSAQDADMWLRLIEEYGPALRLSDATFILHTEHESGRISDNKINGMIGILEKHKDKMNKSQVNFRSFKIIYYESKVRSLIFLFNNLSFGTLIYLIKSKTSRL